MPRRWFNYAFHTSRLIVIPLIASIAAGLSTRECEADEVDFNSQIAPLLIRRCVECHQGTNPSGDLDLTSQHGLEAGGDSGEAIRNGAPGKSLLWQRIRDGEMPPEKQGKPQALPPDEIALIRKWITDGAKWPADRTLDLYETTSEVRGGRDWWSLQPIVRPKIPTVKNVDLVANPVDAFVLARLEEEGLTPAPLADRRTLIRRLHYDVTGLPPGYQKIEAFTHANDDDAWRAEIETLLASNQYGERWARHWLDVVRFAETSGYERDQEKPFAWKYRDWVVHALNEDMPYDRFIVEQLAGDELEDRSESTVIATGLLRLGTWNDEPNDDADYQYERLEDLVHVTSSAFLGLTVKCARCHDHKFDPIPQVDYYRIASAFWPGPIPARDRKLLGGPSAEELGYQDVLGWTDLGRSATPLHVLKNGERHTPLGVAEPGPLSAIPAHFALFQQPPPQAKTTHRRLQLARWIASRDNPLTARVIVNRLWQHHFGEGLVRSPNNFGFRGSPPTHPRLLDWLASELMDNQWSLKHVHRLILNSRTWRQASTHPRYEEFAERDFSNTLWWRSNRRRLDAESMWDQMLSVSGELNLQVGGKSFRPTIAPEALEGLSRRASAWTASPANEQRRRSLYMYTKRHLISPLMTTFDFCDTTLPCAQRDVTTVAPQALAMMNHAFVHDRSIAIAKHALKKNAEDPRARVTEIWQTILGRPPSRDEIALGIDHVSQQEQRFLQPPLTSKEDDRRLAKDVREALAVHLRADATTTDDDGRVVRITDQSGREHHASQSNAGHRPQLIRDAIHGQPVWRFDGKDRYLNIRGTLLESETCTIIAVASDQATHTRHRSILSNWNHTNSTTSLFLGLTGQSTVRWSDAYSNAGSVVDQAQPFLLTAVNGPDGARVFQSTSVIGARTQPITGRRLSTPWVIGQQGNINGEYWHGDIAEIRVYRRALSAQELAFVWNELIARYALPRTVRPAATISQSHDAATLALASLCHVLLNSNEFFYVD